VFWNQAVGDPNAKYDGMMTYLGLFRNITPKNIYIGPSANGSDCGRTGIDCFYATVVHESAHREHYTETNVNLF
jgi:hypothetical protein